MRYELTDEELLAIHQDHLDFANREILRWEAEAESLPEEHKDGAKARLESMKQHKAATVAKAKETQKRLRLSDV